MDQILREPSSQQRWTDALRHTGLEVEKGNTGGGWESAPTVGLLEVRILKRPFLVVRASDDNTRFSKKKEKDYIQNKKGEVSSNISMSSITRCHRRDLSSLFCWWW